MTEIFENQIPIEKEELIENLAHSLPPKQQQHFRYFAKLLDIFCKDKFSTSFEKLKTHYRPFNPDRESPVYLNDAEEQYYAKDLAEKFHVFLEQQNYQKIDDHDILDILEQYKLRGVKIKIPRNQYRDLVVYFREELTEYSSYRKWYTLWLRKYHKKSSYYKRIAVFFRPYRESIAQSFSFRVRKKWKKLRQEQTPRSFLLPQQITLKLFKDINEDSLPVLFPGISVEMGLFSKILISLLSCTIAVCLPLMLLYTWANPACLITIFVSGCLITRELYTHRSKSARYHSKLLNNFYHNSLNDNLGVISHLIQNAEEDTYKQIILITYALWSEEKWAFYPINSNSICDYVQDFVLKRFGIKTNIDVSRIAYQLLSNSGGDKWLEIPKIIDAIYAHKAYLQYDVSEQASFIDVEKAEEPIPLAGKLVIASGTKIEQQNSFTRKDFRLYIDEEAKNSSTATKFSHAPGASARWIPDQPIRSKISEKCTKGSDVLQVFSGDVDNIPLRGMGKIGVNGDQVEFRYVRNKNKNELYLTAALRYRHIAQNNSLVMVRLIPPKFNVKSPLKTGALSIPLDNGSFFPQNGIILANENQYLEYSLSEESDYLNLHMPLEVEIPENTEIKLIQPQAIVPQKLKKGNWLIPVPYSKLFSIRGILVLGADTKNEERVPYQRPVIKLVLEKPLQFKHAKGSSVFIEGENVKLRLIRDASAGAKEILVHGNIQSTTKGRAVLNPGEINRETFYFQTTQQYLHLLEPLKYSHDEGTIVAENVLESSLKYEASQGSYSITLEDASSFSSIGTVEINFNGNFGIKEVHAFRRQRGSNTLILTKKMRKNFTNGTPIAITGVENTTSQKISYNSKFVDIDFSFVPKFPQSGKIILEPGSQLEEIIYFRRYPNRLFLNTLLSQSHKKGTAITFPMLPQFSTSEPIVVNSRKILLENGQLLPNAGKILLQDDIVKYSKYPTRVLLTEPCRYYHVRGSLVQMSEISQNIKLAEYAEKGSNQIKVVNAQELPKKGTIEIKGFFSNAKSDFTRKGDTLFLDSPLPKNFSIRATLNLPDLYLQTHLSPGMSYLEISDPSYLPQSGVFHVTTGHTGLFSRRKKQKGEILHFRYRPDTLWLDTTIKKQYPADVPVKSYDYNICNCASLQVNSLQTAVEKLKSFLHSKLLE